MAHNILMLIKLDTDNIAHLSLVLSVVAVIVSLVSAIAAVFAAFYSKKANTNDGLTPVKENTRHVEQFSNRVLSIVTPIERQEEPEASEAEAQRVSISVEGEAMGEVPLELLVTLEEPSVRVSRVERLTEGGKTLGSSPCKATDNALVFRSILAPDKVREWWDAGESASDGEVRSVLRVYLRLDGSGREVYRDVAVSIVEGLRNVGIATLVVWNVTGST